MNQAEATKVWLEVIERVKDHTLQPSLWRALDASHGVTMEGDVFIVGFTAADVPLGGYLLSSEHRLIIENLLGQEVHNPKARIKIIEGVNVADYEAFKKREDLAEATRQAALQRKHVERVAERAWETIAEQCSRKYARTHLRQLPQVRAQFMHDAIQMISDALDQIHPDGYIDDIGHRALGRVIEKVATLVDVPGAVVAAELIRKRGPIPTNPPVEKFRDEK